MKVDPNQYFSFSKIKEAISNIPDRNFTAGENRFTKGQLKNISDDEIEKMMQLMRKGIGLLLCLAV